ncbi:hypothetical protein T439DRAFT_324749 [Meredithblackwellia eburnea MCA 4105]
MDEPGFHARRRAERQERDVRRLGKLGGLAQTKPIDDRVPLDIPPPVGDGLTGYQVPGYRPPPSVPAELIPGASKPGEGLQGSVSAPGASAPGLLRKSERRMDPHLQTMLGPILRYDTVVNHVWHGFSLLVTSDEGSVYHPQPPTMTIEWDATGGGAALEHHLQQLDLNKASQDEHVNKRVVQGQQIYHYTSLSGGQTFWRFKLEIPLGEMAEEIFYSVNNGPESSFHVPAFDEHMRWVGHSCNGFSAGVDAASFNGPDPLWRDVLRSHEQKPFHVLIGGGDQLYCDPLTREPEMQSWISCEDESQKKAHPMTDEMKLALDRFLFNHYCNWFRSGAFGEAIKRIPMLNMCDDHDIIDGFGSYPDDLMSSPVFSYIGHRGYFWYLLFQNFIVDDVDGTNKTPGTHPNKSMVFGGEGAWIPFPSHNLLAYLGPKVYILLLDTRSERKRNQICSRETYDRVFAAIKGLPQEVEHLVVLLGVPIAYPRMTALETVMESKLNPLTMLAKKGALGLGGFVNKFNKDVELLDDMIDHWCAAPHKQERNWFIEQLQQIQLDQRLRISFLSGDVHAAAVSKLHNSKNHDLAPAKDQKFMLQVISSAIVNTPPPPAVLLMVSTFGKKRHKTLHHVDTDETLYHLFEIDTDGSKNKIDTIMGRRNYCVVDWQADSGDLRFDLRVETQKGAGTTKGYSVTTPKCGW